MSRGRRVAGSTLAVVLAGHLLGGAGHGTLASFSDGEVVAGTVSTATCFTPDDVPPSVSTTVISKTGEYSPGFIRQGGAYYVYANVADGGCAPSGISTVDANVSTITTGATAIPLAPGTFAVGGVSYDHRSASVTADGTLAAGATPYAITSTDDASNTRTQTGYSVTVDNTRPTATGIEAVNGAATAGKPEAGDNVTLIFSEPLDPESVLAGWTGAPTSVVVRIANSLLADELSVRNATNAAQLPLGTAGLGGTTYVSADRDFGATGTPSTMAQSGATITITLGTPSGATGTQVLPAAVTWTPSATATDRAGNACQTTVVTESALDVEF